MTFTDDSLFDSWREIENPVIETMKINSQKVPWKVRFEYLLPLLLAICAVAIKPATANDEFDASNLCPDPNLAIKGNLSNGSEYLICPSGESPLVLNTCAVLFAHGTVNALEVDEIGNITKVTGGKLENIEDQLTEDLIKLAAPCAFAVVSRQETGVFVEEKCGQDCELVAIRELTELAEITKVEIAQKLGISEDDIDAFGTGASQGGLLMTLAQERTDLFDGAIPACGTYISNNQVKFQHDAIVVFDYLFVKKDSNNFITTSLFDEEASIPTIPDGVIENWDDGSDSDIESQIRIALKQQWSLETREFLRVLQLEVPLEQATVKLLENFDDAERDMVARQVRDSFRNLVFNLMDFQQKLCVVDESNECTTTGNTFSNETRVYSGSDNDLDLNSGVRRFGLDSVDTHAVSVLNARHKVSGRVRSFTTTLHGIGEISVPYDRHAIPYWLKASFSDSATLHKLVPVNEIAHCQFDPVVAFLALLDLRQKVASSP